jgi:hypothetical protein
MSIPDPGTHSWPAALGRRTSSTSPTRTAESAIDGRDESTRGLAMYKEERASRRFILLTLITPSHAPLPAPNLISSQEPPET